MAFYAAGRTVYACDAATGADRWSTPVAGTVLAGMTLADGRLFVPAGERAMHCLDTATGSILWTYDVPRPIMMNAAGGGGKVVFGSMDSIIRALDAATGKEAWTFPMSKPEDIYTTAAFWPPIVAGNTVVAGKIPASRDEKNLAALNLADGSPIWSVRLGGGVYRPLASSDGAGVFVSAQDDKGGGVQRLSAADGSPVWSRTGCAFMLAAVTDGASLVVRDSFTTSCLDAATGDLRWTYRTSTGSQGAYYGPHAMAVRGNTAIIGTLDGVVMALRW
jgi:outer membrane protein assembly factor BamB